MALDLLMEGYVPLIETDGILYDARDYPPRIRGIVPGKTEQEISIHPEVPLNFGMVKADAVSQQAFILIVNRGYNTVTVDTIEVVGDFLVMLPDDRTIQPGNVMTVSVRFIPKRTGDHTGAIYVTAGNASGERFLKLIGIGN